MLLAKLGYDAFGIDSSSTAVKQANEYDWINLLAPDSISNSLRLINRRIASLSDINPSQAQVLTENFFEWNPPEGGFDLVYDYTYVRSY